MGNCHNSGESLILLAVSTIISAMTTINAREILQLIPLSSSTVSRRIDEVAEDIEKQLVCLLRSERLSQQLDETLLQDNDALLMAYARFRVGTEEMLFARRIKTDVTGLSIFDEMKGYLREKNIPAENITACATDGAACMVGRYRGFIAYLKKLVPTVFTVHCIIHWEHLVSKNLGGRLQQELSHVTQVVNFTKSRLHKDRLFHQLCEEFRSLLTHTEVRWLSKGNCLQRFVTLWDSVVAFLPSAERKKILEAKVDIYSRTSVSAGDTFQG
ncbi:hypothetical protein M514_10236 [Trichuris suis]|uniref:DUF4371 domain-containing protein n=1 Tax=Trichuris suis TaxID=68888 RepID=A0A085N9T5_9BILA|nr:hypothetical protein M513_10236 [Trichuris suis]KFD66231.1 hypothetical protein M514_10236 [Trichuris suis]